MTHTSTIKRATVAYTSGLLVDTSWANFPTFMSGNKASIGSRLPLRLDPAK